MSTHEIVPTSIDIQWTQATSANGATYSIGQPPLDVEAAKEETMKPQGKEARSEDGPVFAMASNDDPQPGVEIPCSLQYTGNQQFTYTDASFRKKTNIEKWGIWRNPGDNNYSIVFTNEAHWDYYFKDESGDTYRNNTFRNGDHSIMYHSEKPNIVSVRVQ